MPAAHAIESRTAAAARAISAIALGLAVSASMVLASLRVIHAFQPNLLAWDLKSAFPLIFIGVAFAALQFAAPRARGQIILGLMVSLAFVLWGTEQFLRNQAIAASMDDIVVLLFVSDLAIVIHGHLKQGGHPVGKELPFDEPGA